MHRARFRAMSCDFSSRSNGVIKRRADLRDFLNWLNWLKGMPVSIISSPNCRCTNRPLNPAVQGGGPLMTSGFPLNGHAHGR